MTGSGELTLMVVGDVHIDRPKPSTIFSRTQAILAGADVLMGNQEGPVTDRGQPISGKADSGSPDIRAAVGAMAAQAEAGFSAMSLANNHTMDFGPEGLFHTIDLLQEHKIAFSGGGKDLEQAHRPALLECKGVRIAMLGYTTVFPSSGFAAGPSTPGLATVKVDTSYQLSRMASYQPGAPSLTLTVPVAAELERMLQDIARARQNTDVVVVQMHWGVAGHQRVVGYMKEMGRAAIDAGADLVVGNHAHVLLGVERYRNGLICYSVNHFALDRPGPDWNGWHDAVILKALYAGGRFQRLSLVPIATDEKTRVPEPAAGQRYQDIRATLERLSGEFGTIFTREGDDLVVEAAESRPPQPRAPAVLTDPAQLWRLK